MPLDEKLTIDDVRRVTHEILQAHPDRGYLLVLTLIRIRENYGTGATNENHDYLKYVLEKLKGEYPEISQPI